MGSRGGGSGLRFGLALILGSALATWGGGTDSGLGCGLGCGGGETAATFGGSGSGGDGGFSASGFGGSGAAAGGGGLVNSAMVTTSTGIGTFSDGAGRNSDGKPK